MVLITEEYDRIRAQLDAHNLAGRMSNGPAWRAGQREMVSFCSCGLAFYGRDRTEADNRYSVHRRDALGEPGLSLEVREDGST